MFLKAMALLEYPNEITFCVSRQGVQRSEKNQGIRKKSGNFTLKNIRRENQEIRLKILEFSRKL